GDVINAAAQAGIGEIIRQHPRFRKFGNFMAGYLDKNYLSHTFDQLYANAQANQMPPEQIESYLTNQIANQIASGGAFDSHGKEVILRRSLSAKATGGKFLERVVARRQLEGEKYLDKALGAWNQIYTLAKEGGYNLPAEIEEPMKYLNTIEFATPAVDILKEADLIDSRQYSRIKENIRRGFKQSHAQAVSGLEKYSTYGAAAIFGVLGISLLVASGLNLTGGVIGSALGKNLLTGVIGSILVISALALLLKKPRKR
ncbi:MAG: hypothetical protein M1165_02840, partial [Candidatus Pacearchaeota archaeon]|nr:hypothetical protein [Candidatus Pacearchaeota archaeon]